MIDIAAQDRNRRLVIIGAGRMGKAVVQAFRHRVRDRYGPMAGIACLTIVGAGSDTPGDGVWGVEGEATQVVLPLDHPAPAARPEAKQALTAAKPAIIAALVDALARISQIHPSFPSPTRSSLPRSSEVAVFVVAALDEPVGGAVPADLALWARDTVEQRLSVAAQVTGLLFLPDLLGLDDPAPAMARTYESLRDLDGRMGGKHSAGRRRPPSSNKMSTEPIFDAGCFLLGALNGQGLALEEPAERIELAAEVLVQLTTSPLREAPESVTALLQGAGERPQGYGGVGLAAWVYPGRALAQGLSRRLADELLSACLDEPACLDADATEMTREAKSLLVEGLAGLAGELLPPELLEEAGVWQPLTGRLSPRGIHRFRKRLEDEAAGRLEPLAAQRPALDHKAQALGNALAEQLAEVLARRLDRAEPGRLAEATSWLGEILDHLDLRRQEAEETADAHWRDLEAVDESLEQISAEMDALAARFPILRAEEGGGLDWRGALKLIRSPRRLARLCLAYRDLDQRGATYRALLARQMDLALDVLEHDLLVEVYQKARRKVAEQQAQVVKLAETCGAAQRSLHPDGKGKESTHWLQIGSASFGLEHSVLTAELVEDLYEPARGALADRLAEFQAQSPLSAWLREKPDAETITTAYLAYACDRCQGLEGISVDKLVFDSLPDPRQRAEALRVLVSLSSPFLGWDETRLRDEEQQLLCVHTALGTGEGANSPLLEGLDDRLLPGALRGGSSAVRVVATDDVQRVTALTLVRGLPLVSLAGWEEYAAAYHDVEQDAKEDDDEG